MNPRGSAKYAPLAAYLAAQPGDQVRLTFAELEAILGSPLPPTVGTRAWWVNTAGPSQAHAWLGVGWRRAAYSVRERWVVFERQEGQP